MEKKQGARADWPAVRLAYVNGAMTLREVAEHFHIKAAGVMTRAAKEGWEEERKQRQAETSTAAQARITETRAQMLARFNEDDLRVARAIRARAAAMLATAQQPADLRALASAMDTAQKIGRLALGATTGNTGHSDPDGGPIPITTVPVNDYLKARAEVLQEF